MSTLLLCKTFLSHEWPFFLPGYPVLYETTTTTTLPMLSTTHSLHDPLSLATQPQPPDDNQTRSHGLPKQTRLNFLLFYSDFISRPGLNCSKSGLRANN